MVFGFGRQKALPEQIFNAVRRNDFNALQRLMGNMADHASPSVYAVMQDLEWTGNREGQTALCLAAQQGQRDAVALLIRKGANINACSSRRDGGTPLHEAASSIQRPIVQMLMSAGASPFVENRHGDTAYDIAIVRKAVLLVRDMERLSHLGAYMQLKVPTFFGLAKDFKEFWGVVLPRLPPPGPAANGGQRVRHTQVYLFLTYDAAVPSAKIWTDGAQMFASQQGRQTQIFVLMLHLSHAAPANLSYTHDPHSGRMCLVFKASQRPGHGGALATLLTIVNSNAAQATGPAGHSQPLPGPNPPSAPGQPPSQPPGAPSAAPQYPLPQVMPPPPPTAPPAPAMPPPPDHVMSQASASAGPSAGPSSKVPEDAAAPAGLAAASAASAPAAAATGGKGAEDEDEQMTCVICMERPKALGFLHGHGESLHACACKECGERWFREHGSCPVCNQRADTIVPVFW